MVSRDNITRGSESNDTLSTLDPPSERDEENRFGRQQYLEFESDEETEQNQAGSDESVTKLNWEAKSPCTTVIKVLGVGGGGCNAVASMLDQGFEGVEFYAINTDYQALQRCAVPNRIQIGENLTHGTGAGAIPSIGEQAAREAEDRIRDLLAGADMAFITAGLGGGTGTGAAPVIAEIARSMNILNVAIVTRPFTFEGMQRMRRAMEGHKKLGENVDTMISILNDKLMEVAGPKTPLTEAFSIANHVLAQGIRAISDLITMPGLINVDFRDVRTIMGETGGAVMGVGVGKGENRAVEAVRKACHSPLQEKIVIDGAKGILINITGPADITMHEINEATSLVYETADPDANVIFGVVIDNNMHDAMRVTIIATGFGTGEDAEGFANLASEKLRIRSSPLKPPLDSPSSDDSEDAQAGEAAPPESRPAILAKREREAMAPPQVDFRSAQNPLREWENEGGEPEPEAQTQEAKVPAQPMAEVATVARPSVLNDSEPADEDDAPQDADYESPALRRRRRPRFFE